MSPVPPLRAALTESLQLSAELLRNIELAEIPLANAALKACRLARLLNDFDWQRLFEFESGGYPSTSTGVPADAYRLAVIAGRTCSGFDKAGKMVENMVYLDSIDALEQSLRTQETTLATARDPNITIQSANPNQFVVPPVGNNFERQAAKRALGETASRIAARRTLIYRYALSKHYELKYSGIADDIFTRIRERVDSSIGIVVPDAIQKFAAVYENLQSKNPEDWANAVHSCRRILQTLADALFPATDVPRVMDSGGRKVEIKLGADQYINRLIAFVEDNATSGRFVSIVGSHMKFLGERLDSVFQAAQKGSHAEIVSREEADRYVVYTYMLTGDILSLHSVR